MSREGRVGRGITVERIAVEDLGKAEEKAEDVVHVDRLDSSKQGFDITNYVPVSLDTQPLYGEGFSLLLLYIPTWTLTSRVTCTCPTAPSSVCAYFVFASLGEKGRGDRVYCAGRSHIQRTRAQGLIRLLRLQKEGQTTLLYASNVSSTTFERANSKVHCPTILLCSTRLVEKTQSPKSEV